MVGLPLISAGHDEPAVESPPIASKWADRNTSREGAGARLRGGQRTGQQALKRDADGTLVNTSDPGFAGAGFPTIAANTFDGSGRLVLPPYRVVERAGVRVGFIGATTTRTPNWLLARHAVPFRFGDVSQEVNRWVPVLRAKGVEAIVVLPTGCRTDDSPTWGPDRGGATDG